MMINVILVGRLNDAKASKAFGVDKERNYSAIIALGVEYNAPHSALSPQSQGATSRQEISKSCQRL